LDKELNDCGYSYRNPTMQYVIPLWTWKTHKL
jgi:hypothetical protein